MMGACPTSERAAPLCRCSVYAKVFRSLWDGTLGPDWQTWSVFVFLLAHSDPDGFVEMTPASISARSGIPIATVRSAIIKLESPDHDSRSTEHEGRRLERIDEHRSWGWRIVNYLKYRELRDMDDRRQQNREAQARRRASARVSQSQPTSADVSQRGPIQKEMVCIPPDKTRTTPESEHFTAFYEAYPRKMKRPDALKAWKQMGCDALVTEVAAGLQRWRVEWRKSEARFIPYPGSWLRAQGWRDEPVRVRASSARLREVADALEETNGEA